MKIFALEEAGRDAVVARLVDDLEPNSLLLAACTGALGTLDIRVAKRGNDITGVLGLIDSKPRPWLAADVEDDNSMAKLLDAIRADRTLGEVICRVQRRAVPHLERHTSVAGIERRALLVRATTPSETPSQSGARLLASTDRGSVTDLLASLSTPDAEQASMQGGPACGVFDGDHLVAVCLTRYVTPWIAEIIGAYTISRYRRQGFASRCLQGVVGALGAQTKRICAFVSPSNTPGRELARRNGFVERGEAFHLLTRL